MNIVANPVRNDEGERIGVVAEWLDRTREVMVEREIEEIVDSVKIGRLDKRVAGSTRLLRQIERRHQRADDIIERVFKDVGSTMESMAEGDLTTVSPATTKACI